MKAERNLIGDRESNIRKTFLRMNPGLVSKNYSASNSQIVVFRDDLCIEEVGEENEPTTVNECNEREEVPTVEVPSSKMPVANHISSNKNLNNSKITNDSHIRDSTKADFSSMQRFGTKQSYNQNYSAVGNNRLGSHSIFSSMGSDALHQTKQRPVDFPYQSSSNLVTMPGEKVVFRSIENEYDNFS